MKVTDVFLFIMYGMAAGYVIYFVSYIYNKSTGSVVYNQVTPVYSETVLYPWNGGYNWWPYWIGSGWSGGDINRGTYNYKNIGHIGNYTANHTRGSYHSGNRPWGSNSGRGANGGGGGHAGGGHGGGAR